MNHIEKLVSKGEELSSDISLSNYEEISVWFKEVQIYAETKHKGLNFTESIISDVTTFKDLRISEGEVYPNYFNEVLLAAKAMKNYEDNNKSDNQAFVGRFM